jgi:hypothetical protein
MTTDLFCLFFPFLIYEFITGLLTREKRAATLYHENPDKNHKLWNIVFN